MQRRIFSREEQERGVQLFFDNLAKQGNTTATISWVCREMGAARTVVGEWVLEAKIARRLRDEITREVRRELEPRNGHTARFEELEQENLKLKEANEALFESLTSLAESKFYLAQKPLSGN